MSGEHQIVSNLSPPKENMELNTLGPTTFDELLFSHIKHHEVIFVIVESI